MTTTTATDRRPDFALLLRRHRRVSGLTQGELAERAGLSRRAISDLERGERRAPYHVTVDMLATALELAPADRGALAASVLRSRHRPAPEQPAGADGPPAGLTAPPIPPTSLLGRGAPVAAATALLEQDEVRLLTLTGPGGVGKTRLALEVAGAARDAYPDGLAFIALAALADPALVPAAVARAVGLRESSERPLREHLIAHLHKKRLLLLFDNFEHVAAATPLLADLLAACPGLTLLITSRAPLRLRGEYEFPVPPLPLPDPAATPDLATLCASAAVALFVERARAAGALFALSPANVVAVAAICRRLDGLPLAIELAGARARLLPPPALLARLNRSLDVLGGGSRDLPERHQTMRAAIDWSYTLLPVGEQALFRQLAVFAGGAALEEVEAICRTLGDDPGVDALDGLGALLDKSLIWQQDDADGEPRVGMLQTIRAYGLDRLATSGEEGRTRQAHAAFYRALADQAEREVVGPAQEAWLRRLEAEHDNLRQALDWTLTHEGIEAGARMALALLRFWWVRGHVGEGRAWFEKILAPGHPWGGPAASSVRARALCEAGWLAYLRQEYERAAALSLESLALYRDIGEPWGIARALDTLAQIAGDRGNDARAIALYEESLALRRTLSDRRDVGASLCNLGNALLRAGDVARAEPLHAESLAIFRVLGDTKGVSTVLNIQGSVANGRGEYARAAVLYEEALALARDIGDTWATAAGFFNLAEVARELGDDEGAAALHRQALLLSDELGDTILVVACLDGLAGDAAMRGHAARAARLLGAAAARREEIGMALSGLERATHDRTVVAARTALEASATARETTFEQEYAAGRRMSATEAIAYALEA